MFSLICVWINGWVKNDKAGDLRRYRAHYDVTVMAIVEVSCNEARDGSYMVSVWSSKDEILENARSSSGWQAT